MLTTASRCDSMARTIADRRASDAVAGRPAAAATIATAILGIVLGCLAGFYRFADAVISRRVWP